MTSIAPRRRLRAAVAAEPSYADAHYTLGAVLKARRDWTGAAASLRRAIALRPDLPAAHYTLAQVLQQAGDKTGARTHFAEAERLRQRAQLEQEASVWTAVGTRKLDGGDLAGALDQFRRATAVFEAYAPAHYQMGRTLAAARSTRRGPRGVRPSGQAQPQPRASARRAQPTTEPKVTGRHDVRSLSRLDSGV